MSAPRRPATSPHLKIVPRSPLHREIPRLGVLLEVRREIVVERPPVPLEHPAASRANVWVRDWPLIVTHFGWALILGGASRIVAPRVVEHVGGAMVDRPTMTRIVGAFWALLGAFLTVKAYA